MRRRKSSAQTSAAAAFLALLVGTALCAPAAADPIVFEPGISLNPILFGSHQSFDDKTTIAPIPVPILEARIKSGPFEFEAFGLPALAAIPHSDAVEGPTSTRLSILDATLRAYDPLHRYSVGVGETLYNQETAYVDALEIPGTGEYQASRVVGGHYELGYHIGIGKGHLDAFAALAPAMRGVQLTIYDDPLDRGRYNPELADQIDLNVRWERQLGAHRSLFFGLRYINYTAHYDQPGGGLSDRNVGFLPAVGMHWQIGH
jgi:hypothetical protein